MVAIAGNRATRMDGCRLWFSLLYFHSSALSMYVSFILGFHPRDETAMLVYKTIENGLTSFA